MAHRGRAIWNFWNLWDFGSPECLYHRRWKIQLNAPSNMKNHNVKWPFTYLAWLLSQKSNYFYKPSRWSNFGPSNVKERLSNLYQSWANSTSIKFLFLMSHLYDIIANPKWLRAIEHHFTQSQFLSIPKNIFWKQPQPIAADTQIALLDAEFELSEWIDSWQNNNKNWKPVSYWAYVFVPIIARLLPGLLYQQRQLVQGQRLSCSG